MDLEAIKTLSNRLMDFGEPTAFRPCRPDDHQRCVYCANRVRGLRRPDEPFGHSTDCPWRELKAALAAPTEATP